MQLSIVGMSCRLPGNVSSLRDYWELMSAGNNTSSHIPFDRWDAFSTGARSALSEEEKRRISFGSFVNDIEFFDPSFFNISKAEAKYMSPLQRVLMECSYLALLDAGYTANEMKGLNCGVFVLVI